MNDEEKSLSNSNRTIEDIVNDYIPNHWLAKDHSDDGLKITIISKHKIVGNRKIFGTKSED